MALHWLFLGNVAAHLVALMSGLVSFIFAIYTTVKKKEIASWIFWGVFLLSAFAAADQAWQDEHRNTEVVKIEKAAAVAAANTCEQNAQIEHAYARGLEGRSQNAQQIINRQQQDVSRCVISLGKMNPKVREEIAVTVIYEVTVNAAGKVVGEASLQRTYVSLMLITTNETEPDFHGFIKCEKAFNITGSPRIAEYPPIHGYQDFPPTPISDREYEISAPTMGLEWSPARPVYLKITTETRDPGSCTFTPEA